MPHNPWRTDSDLLRFCRARKVEITKVIQMIKDTIEWKSNNNIDTICQKDLITEGEREIMKSLWPSGYLGVDKLGRPLLVE